MSETRRREQEAWQAYREYKQRIALFPQEDVETYEQWLEHERDLLTHDKAALRDTNAALVAENDQLRTDIKFMQTRDVQYRLERENSQLLWTTLKKAAPDALKAIQGQLHQSTNEGDKAMAVLWRRLWKAMDVVRPFAFAARDIKDSDQICIPREYLDRADDWLMERETQTSAQPADATEAGR